MKRRHCQKGMRMGLAVTIMAALGALPRAQTTPPYPAFDITRHPGLFYNVSPTDVNEDGITDLVAGTRALNVNDEGDVVVAIGRGNGTFDDYETVAVRARPLTTADLNADGFADIVIFDGASVQILAGYGDGTFEAPRPVTTMRDFRELRLFAYAAADFNGDGHRDLILPDWQDGQGAVLKFLPGAGAFTFGAPILLPADNNGMSPSEVTSGDFNGDGRPDFALVNLCCTTSVYLNGGGNTFTRSEVGGGLNDVVAADMNGDGRLDLVGAAGRWETFQTYEEFGEIHVLLGAGNGTFAAPVRYSTGVHGGATSVVVGDFNGDGRLDVATGNRSVIEDQEIGRHLYDSVTILRGTGGGGFMAPVSFAIDYVWHGEFGIGWEVDSPYWAKNHQLKTSDLNGDRRIDLITSPGATLLNRAPQPNEPPQVFAGPDRAIQTNDNWVLLGAQASDPDHDWLTYRWTDDTGQVIGTTQSVKPSHDLSTTRTYTVTVSDGRGGSATDSVTIRNAYSDVDPYVAVGFPHAGARIEVGVPVSITFGTGRTDGLSNLDVEYSLDDGRTFSPIPGCSGLPLSATTCTWTNPGPATINGRIRVIARGNGDWIGISGRFAIVTGPILPAGWATRDIGAVGAAGSTTESNGTWLVEGSGADIWGAADEFRYAYRTAGTDFTVTARVANIENLHRWVKAGVMIREDLSPGSRHVSLLATPRTDRGIAFQRRLTTNGDSVHTDGPAIKPPVWLRVGRAGNTISAYYGTSATGPWHLVGRETVPNLRQTLYVGLAVSSHVDGALATARFDNVSLVQDRPMNRPEDIGNVALRGRSSFDGVVYTLEGSGADIWGTADAFHYLWTWGYYSSFSINSIAARVRSVESTHHWAKAGVMYRQITGSGPWMTPDERHVMVIVSPGRGIAMQYRPVAGGPSVQVAVRPGAAPAFVRLTQSGDTFVGATSADGITWQTLGQVTMPSFQPAPGLVVTSHDNTQLATATFDELRLTRFGEPIQ